MYCVLCVRSPYAPRASRVCPEYDPLCCRNLDTCQKGSRKKWWVSLRLLFSHPRELIASDPFTDVSVSVSQGESCPGLHPTVDRLAGGPWPSPYWVGGPLKDTQVGPTCTDKGHTAVTRATATGAEDMAISLDPPGQRRHQRSRWSRPGGCRTGTVPVVPRSTRRATMEISHPKGKRGNRRSSLQKETQ